jgi:hypothetical protein
MNRRGFLKSTAVAGLASVAAPHIESGFIRGIPVTFMRGVIPHAGRA